MDKFIPRENEHFWFIDSDGEVIETFFVDECSDIALVAFGNCFRTKSEAINQKEAMLEKMKDTMGW